MSATVVTLRKSDSKGIVDEPDFVFRSKRIGRYCLELIGGTNRGAMINVWEKMEAGNLDHIFTPSDDRTMRKANEIHFMHFGNAKDEWAELRTVRAVLDLMWRNA